MTITCLLNLETAIQQYKDAPVVFPVHLDMSRRSPSPEGVGDLLRQDSFDMSDDEQIDNSSPTDPTDSEPIAETSEKPRLKSICIALPPRQREAKKHEPIPFPQRKISRKRGIRQTGSDGEPRYFVVKTIHAEDVKSSIQSGVWKTQVIDILLC